MEITIKNGRVTIIGATKEELVNFAEFVNGSPIPYNTVDKTEDIVIEAEVVRDSTEPEEKYENIVGLSRLIGRSTSTTNWHIKKSGLKQNEDGKYNVNEFLKYCEGRLDDSLSAKRIEAHKKAKDNIPVVIESDEYNVTIPQITKEMGTYHQLLESRVSTHKIPYVFKGKTRYFKRSDWEKEFAEHPIDHKKGVGKKIVKLETTPYSLWRQEQSAKVRMSGKDIGKTFSLAYKELTKVYGIVWDQVAKDYKNAKGHSHNATIELVYFLQYEQNHNPGEHYENLFENEIEKLIAA